MSLENCSRPRYRIAVVRWDLRPDDWHLIWSELVDHPCALLFAPKHPHRNGPRRYKDWVDSWPEGFDWQTDLPEHLAPEPAPDPDVPDADAPSGAPTSSQTLDRLAELLLAVSDADRDTLARKLSALALAPDSALLVQSTKLALLGVDTPAKEGEAPSARHDGEST